MSDRIRIALFAAASFLAMSTAVVSANAQEQGSRDLHGRMAFEGRFLVSVQDADMVSSAYVDGQLGPREGHDTLSVIPLEGDPRDWSAHEVFASNSVAGPPNAVNLSPDGRYAIVIETFKPRPDNDEPHTFADLTFGSKAVVFDLTDLQNPQEVQELSLPLRPDSVSFNAAGTLVSISYGPNGSNADTPLTLHRFENGQLGQGVAPAVPGWTSGDRMIDTVWHPDEDILVLVDTTRGATLTFARVSEDLSLAQYGNIVDIGRAPFRALFTPDGNHVVVSSLNWGPDIAGTWIEAPVGSVQTVRMNAETRSDGSVRHALVDHVQTGVSPEGLAVSPDGRWVATTNLERSYLPYEDPRITWWSSITLARLDQDTGQLALVGTFNYDGILPEAAVFDNSGSFLAVANYDHFDDRKTGGSIDFWRIQADPMNRDNVQLIKTEHSVRVARGAHSMVIAR